MNVESHGVETEVLESRQRCSTLGAEEVVQAGNEFNFPLKDLCKEKL